jgi:hypothetical protein
LFVTRRTLVLALFGLGLLGACATREKPTRLLVYASAAMKAAERADAERRAPDAYRKAEIAFWAAKSAYLVKEYEKAAAEAVKARRYAEQAETEAELRAALNGAPQE